MQVDPIKPTLNPPGSERLTVKCDDLLSNLTLNFNVRCYIKERRAVGEQLDEQQAAKVAREPLFAEAVRLLEGGELEAAETLLAAAAAVDAKQSAGAGAAKASAVAGDAKQSAGSADRSAVGTGLKHGGLPPPSPPVGSHSSRPGGAVAAGATVADRYNTAKQSEAAAAAEERERRRERDVSGGSGSGFRPGSHRAAEAAASRKAGTYTRSHYSST